MSVSDCKKSRRIPVIIQEMHRLFIFESVDNYNGNI